MWGHISHYYCITFGVQALEVMKEEENCFLIKTFRLTINLRNKTTFANPHERIMSGKLFSQSAFQTANQERGSEQHSFDP